MEGAGIPFAPELVAPGNFQAEASAAALRGLLAQGVVFDAVFSGDDGSASGVLAALAEVGIEAGRDVSVIGFDDLPFAAHTIPPLATVHAPTEEVGATSVRMLVDRIQGRSGEENAGRPGMVVLPTVFVPRASCGCLSRRGRPDRNKHAGEHRENNSHCGGPPTRPNL